MSDERPVAAAHLLAQDAVAALAAAAGPAAPDTDLLSLLTVCQGAVRQLDRIVVTALAELDRRGTFAERATAPAPPRSGTCSGWTGPRPAAD